MEEIAKSFKRSIITGNKEDRFAMVEVKIAKKLGLSLTCIPHGLEYSYRFPSAVAGDIFYCTSLESSLMLRDIYNDKKFVFDEKINTMIYGGRRDRIKNDSHELVFFTEPRNIHVNQKIINSLQDNNISFKVKLHPADDCQNYPQSDLKFVNDLSEALNSKIFIARKSTVLLDAVYRGSEAISLLIDSKDDYYANYVFPSLSNPKIRKCYKIKDLVNVLKLYYV